MLGYDSLQNYFRTNFSLQQFHGYDIAMINEWIPWEKFVYTDMVSQWVKNQEDLERARAKEIEAKMRNSRRR